jgi:hypothetical protein
MEPPVGLRLIAQADGFELDALLIAQARPLMRLTLQQQMDANLYAIRQSMPLYMQFACKSNREKGTVLFFIF